MSITLYGSGPSPYVRRIRLLLGEMDYQFKTINIYDDDERARFAKISPIKKLPVLVDKDTIIYDSHNICRYIQKMQGEQEQSISRSNLISVIDAVTDSLIILFMGKRSDLSTTDDKLLFRLQNQRIEDCMSHLEFAAKQGQFNDWHYATMALLSLVDWAQFRALYRFDGYTQILRALAFHRNRKVVSETAPQ